MSKSTKNALTRSGDYSNDMVVKKLAKFFRGILFWQAQYNVINTVLNMELLLRN